MKIFFLGDVFGRSGREVIKKYLPDLRKKWRPDLVIANIENMTHGKGFSPDQVDEMIKAGVDYCTSGNHAFDKGTGAAKLNDADFPVLRPANYPVHDLVPGRGYEILDVHGQKILVINLMGRVFMGVHLDCPFRKFDEIYEKAKGEKMSAVFVDFHAEATAEKAAFTYYVDGRASAVVGTHTHVPTRDERIFTHGTAFITDVGFCGPTDSVIGMDKASILDQFLTQIKQKHSVGEGPAVLNAVLIEIDSKTRKAKSIEHISQS